MAPERMRGGKCNETVDVYGFGLLLFCLLTQQADPFPGVSDEEVRDSLLEEAQMLPSFNA